MAFYLDWVTLPNINMLRIWLNLVITAIHNNLKFDSVIFCGFLAFYFNLLTVQTKFGRRGFRPEINWLWNIIGLNIGAFGNCVWFLFEFSRFAFRRQIVTILD